MSAPLTHAEATRALVTKYDSEGDTPERIAERLGLSVDRVERILDQLDVPHEIDAPAPAIEPLLGKVVHASRAGSVSPIRPAKVTQPGPVPTKASPRPVKPAPEPVKPARQPAAKATGLVRVHGSRRGYQQHYRFKEKPCQECKDAWNTSERERHATAREAVAARAAAPGPVRPRVVPARPPQQPRVRPTVQVRWLVPRGEQLPAGTHYEYAVEEPYGMRVVSAGTAEVEADFGQSVFRRLVSDWVEVTG